MPVLRLNATDSGVAVHQSPACAPPAWHRAALGRGPIIVMIHGYKYDPDMPAHCPHTSIFSPVRQTHRRGHGAWLRDLGFGKGDPDEGLAIALGWRARGLLWHAQTAARHAGRALADVVQDLHLRAPHRPIHVITHSMGSEVAFEALHHLPRGAVQRIIALNGASYASRAASALRTPAGQDAELINMTSRENDLFDFAFERVLPRPKLHDHALGAGIDAPNAVTLQLDCPATLAGLAGLGARIDHPQRRICHWSAYTRPGAMAFYARALRHPAHMPLNALQQAVPDRQAPRWSRLRPAGGRAPLLWDSAKHAT